MDTDRKVMISCKEATFLISKKQDTELSMPNKLKLQFHLMMCKYCRRFDTQISFMQRSLARLRKNIALQDVSLSPRQKEKIKASLKNQKN